MSRVVIRYAKPAFWPRSRVARPKQFLALAGDRTLVQQAGDRLEAPVPAANTWVITSEAHVEETRRQLPHLLCAYVHNKNVQALIVVEAGHALAGVWLVKIASNHHWIAAGLGRSRIRRR